MLQHREENHCSSQIEQAEALVKQIHKPFELFVIVVKSCRHDDAADDIADGTIEYRGGIERIGFLVSDGIKKIVNLLLYSGLHLFRSHAPMLHSELLLMQKSSVILPQLSFGIDDPYNMNRQLTPVL